MECQAGDRDTTADHTTTLPTLIDTSRRGLSTVAPLADIHEESRKAVIATASNNQLIVEHVMFYRNESPTQQVRRICPAYASATARRAPIVSAAS